MNPKAIPNTKAIDKDLLPGSGFIPICVTSEIITANATPSAISNSRAALLVDSIREELRANFASIAMRLLYESTQALQGAAGQLRADKGKPAAETEA